MKVLNAFFLLVASLLGTVVSMPAQAQVGYTHTRFPIVLVHGLFGFDQFAGVDYFYRIPAALSSSGARVFVTQQSAANSSEARGEQLLAELRRLKALHGHQKFNLVGHSHGGHTVRYVAAVAPELVASVMTVGSPHQGSPVADMIEKFTGATGTTGLVTSLVDRVARLASLLTGTPLLKQNSFEAMRSMTVRGSQAFNARFPQGAPTSVCGSGPEMVQGVRYFSVGGTSIVTNLLDPTDLVLAFGAKVVGGASDGLVGRCSTRWGSVLRDSYQWNHGDQINHAFGMRGWFTPDPVAFYRSHANRLKNLGL